MEIINYDTYDSADVMFGVMGFGRPLDEISVRLSCCWRSSGAPMPTKLAASPCSPTQPTSCRCPLSPMRAPDASDT